MKSIISLGRASEVTKNGGYRGVLDSGAAVHQVGICLDDNSAAFERNSDNGPAQSEVCNNLLRF